MMRPEIASIDSRSKRKASMVIGNLRLTRCCISRRIVIISTQKPSEEELTLGSIVVVSKKREEAGDRGREPGPV